MLELVVLRDEAAAVEEETSVARASIIVTPKKEEKHDAKIIIIDRSGIIVATARLEDKSYATTLDNRQQEAQQ